MEPNVYRLPAHAENEQYVSFDADSDLRTVELGTKTPLTEWLVLNGEASAAGELARSLTYVEMPKHFSWSPSTLCA